MQIPGHDPDPVNQNLRNINPENLDFNLEMHQNLKTSALYYDSQLVISSTA